MSDVRKAEQVVVGSQGIRVQPLDRGRTGEVFEFMSSQVSSEKPQGLIVRRVAGAMRATRERGEKILWVGGPAVVHTGAGPSVVRLIEAGYMDVLFAGNALATHDIEGALYGTSLGVNLDEGTGVEHGHEHHIRALNTIRRCGSIAKAVEQGVLGSGIMHACVVNGVDFVLGGSVRDDGPLPDTITDVVEAQRQMRSLLGGVGYSLMVASMLHSIATGNLLPASVPLVCVDINPATVTKLADRGSAQATGVVTDVGLFLGAPGRRAGTQAFLRARPLRAGGSVPDLPGLAQGFHRLLDGQQHRRLQRAERTAAGDRQRDRGRGHVVGGLPQVVPVVLTEGVPEPVELPADRLDVLLGGRPAVLRAPDQPGPRLRRVAELRQVQRHCPSSCPATRAGRVSVEV